MPGRVPTANRSSGHAPTLTTRMGGMAGFGVVAADLVARSGDIRLDGVFPWGPMQIVVAVLAASALTILVVIATRLHLHQRRERRVDRLAASIRRAAAMSPSRVSQVDGDVVDVSG